MSSWWDLPGPSSFVADVADDLRAGRSVTVEIPEHAPPNLPEAVRAALGANWGWLPVPPRSGVPPTETLYDRCLPHSPTAHRTPRSLIAEDDLEGYVLWVDLAAPASPQAWQAFLRSYAEAARSQRHDYPRVALCLHGHEHENPEAIPADLPLAHYRWNGQTNTLDMLAYAARVHHGVEPTPLEQRLAVELVARLSGFDPHTAAHLGRLRLDELHAPKEHLHQVAAKRGWASTDDTGGAPRAWHAGMSDSYHGRTRYHPALFAITENTAALDRIVWQAQIAVVFPFLEERRRDLLDVLAPLLKVPFKHAHGIVRDKADLELGHIYTQLSDLGSRAPSGLLSLTGAFRDARNHLAHLRPLRPEVFRTPPFHAYEAPLDAVARKLRTGYGS